MARRMGGPTIAACCLALAACAPPGPLRTEFESVELGGADSVRAEIRMGAGELRVSGGARTLLEADFEYNTRSWKPQVSYRQNGSRGLLSVRQSSGPAAITVGNVRNRWDLRLNRDVPLDLEVQLGAGKSLLELGGMALRSLEVEMGAGELQLDLSGAWKRDLDVRIRGGVGEVRVWLPGEVGVIAEARGGIGSIDARGLRRRGRAYVNKAYSSSPVTLRLDIKGGIGSIRLIGGD